MLFANVIIDISHEKIDRTFQYIIPNAMCSEIRVGDCVLVPFGRGDKETAAYVLEITDRNEYPIEKLKSVSRISENQTSLEKDAIELAWFIKENYGSTMIRALKCVLPVKSTIKVRERKTVVRKKTKEEVNSIFGECLRKKQNAKVRALKELLENESIPYEFLSGKLNVSAATLNALSRDGVIEIKTEDADAKAPSVTDNHKEKNLSDEQRKIIDEIVSDYKAGKSVKTGEGRYLILGITGSGKTEVYINIIEEVVKSGKQCIMLIPEIALTYQTLMRFYQRFGERVSVINSSLSPGERYERCERAKKGEIDVIIGPRSALFVPFANLGAVIIDEEHESSYISEQSPKYHATEVANELCRIKGACLILGSATPSVNSYYLAKEGYYKLYRLTKRLTGGELPETHIIDMRAELRNGNRSAFSTELKKNIADRLEKNEQVMLFLNRRGYLGCITCRECGNVIKCPHCDVSMVKHRGGKLVCHYCGYETKDVSNCPKCGSRYISGFKVGTEQIEEELKKLFPAARVLRMDSDTTKTKDSYEKILSAFKDKEADILVGTQMIVKGHDFPDVTLVGIVVADLSLSESSFTSGERTFQLLAQAAGRAGRGTKKGLCLIQTYNPDHYSIRMAAKQDYDSFYEEEAAFRSICSYPPFGNMLRVLVQSKDDKRALGLATALSKKVTGRIVKIGPAPDSVSKINDFYRYNLYLKAKNKEELDRTRELMEEYLLSAPLVSESVTFDVK